MPNQIINRRVLYNNIGVEYHPDAQAYFDAIGDVPTYAKIAINQRVLDFESNLGALSAVGMFYPFPPTMEMFDGFREFISNAINGNQVYSTANAANPSPLYNFPRALAANQGLSCWGGGAYRTGFVPSTELILNDTAWAAIYQDTDIAQAAYEHGAFQSATQSIIFQKRSATNICLTDMYGTNVASGRLSYTGTGASGVYISNRRTTTDFKIYENGVEKDSLAATAGSLPTVEVLMNGYKTATTNGGGSNNNLGALCYYTRSLTLAEVALENTSWANFQTAIKRTGTYDVSILSDGDSHFAYWNSLIMRSINWQMNSWETNIHGIAVSGQTLVDMISGDATNLYPKIQSGRGTYYLICGGGTNDISTGATAAATWTNMQTYVADAKTNATSKGVTLIAVHIPLFNREYIGEDAKILEQDVYNELVRNNFAVGDLYVDFAALYSARRSNYGSDAAFITAVRAFCADTTYFEDGTHLIDGALGYTAISTLITSAIIVDAGL